MPRWLGILRRDSVEREVGDEIAFHIEMATRDLIAAGTPPDAARAEALRRFGDAASIDDECRRYGRERDQHARRTEYRSELAQDLSFGARQLAKSRGFSIVAVLTLALGIGATAAVFSVLDAVVLRPLPYPHAERIVHLYSARKGERMDPSAPEFVALRTARDFQSVAAGVTQAGITLDLGGLPEMLAGGRVTAGYFDVFGVAPMLGRTFSAIEDSPGGPGVVVLSHRLWMSHFGGDRRAIGRVVTIDGTPHSVIGVMPASFDVKHGSDDLWVPLAMSSEQATKYGEHYLEVVARLRPEATLESAVVSSTTIERTVVERMPERVTPVREYSVALTRFADDFAGDYRGRLLILFAAVGLVLLIACVNVANLLLARGTSRSRELAIRGALGAGRARLVRQLLTENVMLAAAGAAAGLGVAFALVRIMVRVAPADVPRLEQADVDGRVLLFTLAVAVVSSVTFGLVPALRSVGRQMQSALREGGRGSVSVRDRLRSVLVAAEVALAITLLVGSGLLIRSAVLAQRIAPGFDPRGVLTARLVLPAARYATGEDVVRTYLHIRDEASRIPGVRVAALSSVVPLSGSQMNSSVRAEGTPRSEHSPQADMRIVSDGYFAAMGIPLIGGRDFSRQDAAGSAQVVVVNEALVHELWPSLDSRRAIGLRIEALGDGPNQFREIVGVAANLHDGSLTSPPPAEYYVPIAQVPPGFWPIVQRSLVVVVRAINESAPPETMTEPLRRAVATVDPSLPLAEKSTMESYLHASLQAERMSTLLLSTLGGIALVLAMVGIYGVVAYFVSQRTHEIGLRAALGASPARMWRFVIDRGLRPVLGGLVVGIGLALATTRVLESQLYGVTPRDPLTLAGVAALLLAIALAAMYVPARRAMRVAPIVALNDG